MKVPHINMGRKWFIDTCPDESWDGIREMLSCTKPVLIKKRNFNHTALDSYSQKKRKVVRAIEKANKVAKKPDTVGENKAADDGIQGRVNETSSLQQYINESNQTAVRKPFS